MKNELEIIKFIRKKFRTNTFPASSKRLHHKSKIIKGIGDDSAVIEPLHNKLTSSSFMLFTTDMMIEGIHFVLSYSTPFEIAFKLVARNVSDIYAMGGDPEYLLLDLCFSHECTNNFIKHFFDGIKKATDKYNIKLIGGDLSIGSERIYLAATLIGYSPTPVYRSGARPGDLIYVTGTLGDSACGLEALRRKLDIKAYKLAKIIKKHLLPEPRPLHKRLKDIHAMIDISDGLSIDLWRLCTESGVGAVIYENKIPVSDEMRKAAVIMDLDPLNLALTGGEDYELLFTTNRKFSSKGITEIGYITEKNFIIIGKDGKTKKLKPEGYIHDFTHER